jgi:hypothetical protein
MGGFNSEHSWTNTASDDVPLGADVSVLSMLGAECLCYFLAFAVRVPDPVLGVSEQDVIRVGLNVNRQAAVNADWGLFHGGVFSLSGGTRHRLM